MNNDPIMRLQEWRGVAQSFGKDFAQRAYGWLLNQQTSFLVGIVNRRLCKSDCKKHVPFLKKKKTGKSGAGSGSGSASGG